MCMYYKLVEITVPLYVLSDIGHYAIWWYPVLCFWFHQDTLQEMKLTCLCSYFHGYITQEADASDLIV